MLPRRFWGKVQVTDTCHLWIAGTDKNGYARFRWMGRNALAHRVAYMNTYGPIPDDLELDHLCRVRHCVNPFDLEAVTTQVNILRGETIAASYAAREFCGQGHPLVTENLYTSRGTRDCRECRLESSRRGRH